MVNHRRHDGGLCRYCIPDAARRDKPVGNDAADTVAVRASPAADDVPREAAPGEGAAEEPHRRAGVQVVPVSHTKHEAIIVTTYDPDHMDAFVAEAARLGAQLLGPVESPVNGWLTAVVPPDGGFEGLPDNDAACAMRAGLVAWLRAQHRAQRYGDESSPFEWVHVAYGDDLYGRDLPPATFEAHAWPCDQGVIRA
jgi:hypothetical protein